MLRRRLPRISRLDALMQACAILVLIYAATTILSAVVGMTKIVLLRVTRVIVYL